jgi:glycosyltransferase involved in cell wall biosynthesis
MRIGILADGRSPITRGWLTALLDLEYEVHLLSTFPTQVDLPLASHHLAPVAFSGIRASKAGSESPALGGAAAIQLRAAARRWLGMATFPRSIRRLRSLLQHLDIDVLHALRIPYEGMLAAEAKPGMPLAISVWGNDFTLHARSAPWMGWLTRRAIRRVDGLHADCHRDVRIAKEWGLAPDLPTLVAPGSGGLDRNLFWAGEPTLHGLSPEIQSALQALSSDTPVVINPRGFRAYVRNDTFFQAIPHILREIPATVFLAPAMMGERTAEQWVARLGIEASVYLLPRLQPEDMAMLYRRSQVMVSPSEHDGTPNTFLEAIACGCFPVVGGLESLREWVQDGVNGFLIDPGSPEALANAVVKSLRDLQLRQQADGLNQSLIDNRAERGQVGKALDAFYQALARKGPHRAHPEGGSP